MNTDQMFNKCANILKNRQKSYGNADSSFERIAKLWSMYTRYHFKPQDVAMLMVLFKICREMHEHKEDNIIDAINYLVLYNDLIEKKKTAKRGETIKSVFCNLYSCSGSAFEQIFPDIADLLKKVDEESDEHQGKPTK